MSPAKERSENPDLIVGIDFGLTGTGVAWALPSVDKVESIKVWPGTENQAGKVPSIVVLEGQDTEPAWGFLTRKYRDPSQHLVYSLFKIPIGKGDSFESGDSYGDEQKDEDNVGSYVDPDDDVDKQLESVDEMMDFHKAKDCLTQYLAGLYVYVKKTLSRELPSGTEWQSMNAWFLFSYPTTWGPAATERFSEIVNSSPFGNENGHWVNASYMNEAQASMTSFATEGSRSAPGKVVVIADIGGGTTDVNTYAIVGDNGKEVKLEGKSKASGRDHGSVHIDTRVAKDLRNQVWHTLIESSAAFRNMTLDAKKRLVYEQTALIIKRHDYAATKHGIDKDSPTDREERCQISLDSSASPVATVRFQMYRALKRELRKECESIWNQIEEHLEQPDNTPERVDRLVLTGGMANNALVRDWFEQKVEASKAKGLRIIGEVIFLSEPELSVSKGLVHGALESYKRDDIWLYKALHSYGIVIYNSRNQIEGKQKFLERGKVVSLKKFKKKQTIRFKSGDEAGTALWLARWDSDKNANSITKVGCLTKGLPTPIQWESPKSFGFDAKAEVELNFERRTAIVTFWTKDTTPHQRVFNEEWHAGADQTPPRRLPSFLGLAKIGLGIAGLITFIIDTALGGDAGDGGNGEADKPQRDGKGGPKKGNVEEEEEEGDNGTEEGGGQFDSFEEA